MSNAELREDFRQPLSERGRVREMESFPLRQFSEDRHHSRTRAAMRAHFDGAVYVLVDGGSLSAASDFAAIAAFHQRATFIGEETGGAAEGNNSGVEIGVTLPGVEIRVRWNHDVNPMT